jgi:hypothetical protein
MSNPAQNRMAWFCHPEFAAEVGCARFADDHGTPHDMLPGLWRVAQTSLEATAKAVVQD